MKYAYLFKNLSVERVIQLFSIAAYRRQLYFLALCSAGLSRWLPNFRHYFAANPFFRDDTELCDFLDKQYKLWEEGVIAHPEFKTENTIALLPVKRKILFLYPKYIFSSKNHIRCEFDDIFLETAKAVGFDVDVFYTDTISNPDFRDTTSPPKMNELRNRLLAFNPDIVFLETNFIGDKTTINAEFISEMKLQCRAKFVGYVGDAWHSHGRNVVRYWADACDLVLHNCPNIPESDDGNIDFPLNNLMIPVPVNRLSFHNEDTKDIDLVFSGTFSTGLRAFWLPFAMRTVRNERLNAHIVVHERQKNEALNEEDYGRDIRHAKIVFNFSSRSYSGQPVKALTGRVWQVIASGALLLDEDEEAIKTFFVPFIHYVPFRTVFELSMFIRFFAKNESYRRRIAESGEQWLSKNYNNELVWSMIVSRLNLTQSD